MKYKKEIFGTLSDGSRVHLFTFRYENGSEIKFTNYGATIVSIKLPDKNGKVEEITMGFDNLKDYEKIRNYYGATIGRNCNRLANGKFSLDGKEYKLVKNEGKNHLHGGKKGFDRVVWIGDKTLDGNPGIELSYLSRDGEEGYPGNLEVTVGYSFSNENVLSLNYELRTDKTTITNITNHSYFNLSGNFKENILNHHLTLNAEVFLPVTRHLIPTGEFRNVKDTPMDFTNPHKIGERIEEDYEQLKFASGYDHYWIINDNDKEIKFAGSLYEEKSGRFMEIFTTEPGIQFYSGNFLDDSHKCSNQIRNVFRTALCLETHHFPDSPNHSEFPSIVLKPGEVYKSTTIYKFSIK
jgi:aldose 1-epimerase